MKTLKNIDFEGVAMITILAQARHSYYQVKYITVKYFYIFQLQFMSAVWQPSINFFELQYAILLRNQQLDTRI